MHEMNHISLIQAEQKVLMTSRPSPSRNHALGSEQKGVVGADAGRAKQVYQDWQLVVDPCAGRLPLQWLAGSY